MTLPKEMAAVTPLNRLYTLVIFLSIYLISFIIQALLFLNWDVASLLQATRVLLAGGSYVNDIFTPNPPMILYLYTPPILFAKWFNLDIVTVFRTYIYLLCTLSAFTCYDLIKQYYKNHEPNLTKLFMAILLASYLILPTYEFGNRDHLLIVLVMPYLLATATQLQGKKLDTKYATFIGLLAGIGFALKPQYLVACALVELFVMYHQKKIFACLRIETLVIAIVLLSYTTTIIIFHPEYISIIIPYLIRNYYATISLPLTVLTKYPLTIFCYMAIILTLSWQLMRKRECLFSVLVMALTGFIISVYLQHTLFYYHFLPALTAASLLSGMIIYLFASSLPVTKSDVIKMTALVVSFIAVDLYLYQFAWYNLVYYPWYFYGFFAIIFTLLFFANKTRLSLLAILIRVATIITAGVFCSSLLISTGHFSHDFLCVLLLMSILFILLSKPHLHKFIHSLLLVSLVISIFYVPAMQTYQIYLGPRQYKEHTLSRLTAFIKSKGNHPSIYTFSAAIYYTYPAIFYANAASAQRFDQLWPVMGISNPTINSKDTIFFINMVADDLHKNKPDLIFIDNRQVLNRPFNFVTFFSENQHFRDEWKSYRYLTSLPLGAINTISSNMSVYERIKN